MPYTTRRRRLSSITRAPCRKVMCVGGAAAQCEQSLAARERHLTVAGFCARYNNREGFRAMRKALPWPVASDEKGHCRLHGGASGSVALLANGVGNTVTASGPRPRLRALLKVLRAGLTEHE